MGRTCFIRIINSEEDLLDSFRCIVEHNCAPVVHLGEYSDAEFAQIDPMRAQTSAYLKQHMPSLPGFVSMVNGCQNKLSRGEDILRRGCIVRFDGKLWLEVINLGGGADTTIWLKEHYPGMNWIGTEGKPAGFMEAPMVADGDSFQDLLTAYRAL